MVDFSLVRRDVTKPGLVALVLSLSLAAPVVAGPLEEGVAAAKRGNYARAMRLLRPLADQGDASAQYDLGLMYAKGQGVPQDYAEAVKWFRKAADQGDPSAQYDLGVLYAEGQGVSQDYVQAHKWITLAADQLSAGVVHDQAVKARDLVAADMTPEQIAEAQKLARECKPK